MTEKAVSRVRNETEYDLVQGRLSQESHARYDEATLTRRQRHLRRVSTQRSAVMTCPERRLVSHLFIACNKANYVETEHRMQSLYQRLLIDIRRFSRLAQRHSESPTASEGGSLGWVSRGVLPAFLERVVFSMDADTLSPIFASPEGFHVIYCAGIRPQGIWLNEQPQVLAS